MSFPPAESRVHPSSVPTQSQWPHTHHSDISNNHIHDQSLYSTLKPPSVNSAQHSMNYPRANFSQAVPFPIPMSTYSNTEVEPTRTYVNPKQYHRILKRREVRALLEEKRSLSVTHQNKKKQPQQPYQHVSRHVHATKRQRKNGRFASAEVVERDSNGESVGGGEDNGERSTATVHEDHQRI